VPKNETSSEISSVFRFAHPENDEAERDVTLGSEILSNNLQPLNIPFPNDVQSVKLKPPFRLAQPEKQLILIF
jgi:hypothetical protein